MKGDIYDENCATRKGMRRENKVANDFALFLISMVLLITGLIIGVSI